MLVRRWRAFWQRRNFSKKRSSGCFYVILSIQGFTLFFVFVVLSRISKQMLQNVRIKQIVKLFMLYSLMVTIQRSNTIDNQPFGLIVSTKDWS